MPAPSSEQATTPERSASPPPALSVRGLTKRYDGGVLALDGLSLEVAGGEFFGLLGPNGAGKTTLISAICNLIRVSAGEIRHYAGHSRDFLYLSVPLRGNFEVSGEVFGEYEVQFTYGGLGIELAPDRKSYTVSQLGRVPRRGFDDSRRSSRRPS